MGAIRFTSNHRFEWCDWNPKSEIPKQEVIWWFQMFFLFTPILGAMIQFDEDMFQMGGSTTPRRLFLHVFWKKESFEFYIGVLYDVCASRHAAGKSFRLSEGIPPHEESKKQTCCSVSQGILLLLVVGMMIVHWNLYETTIMDWDRCVSFAFLLCFTCLQFCKYNLIGRFPDSTRFYFPKNVPCAVASLRDVHAVHEGVRSPRQMLSRQMHERASHEPFRFKTMINLWRLINGRPNYRQNLLATWNGCWRRLHRPPLYKAAFELRFIYAASFSKIHVCSFFEPMILIRDLCSCVFWHCSSWGLYLKKDPTNTAFDRHFPTWCSTSPKKRF